MTDLGAGVHEHPDGRVGPGAPRDKLTCPACGLHTSAERTKHPTFAFLCGACWTLFNATDPEWRRLRTQREAVIERRDNPKPALPLMRSHKVEHVEPIQQRVKEHEAE